MKFRRQHRREKRQAPRDNQSTIKPRSPVLEDQLRQAGDLFLNFQSRTVKTPYMLDIDKLLPTEFAVVGAPIRVDYRSDKDDPETRVPAKRARDPDGVQGVWKNFTHRHDGPHDGLKLYAPVGTFAASTAGCAPSEGATVQWPKVMDWLADFVRVEYVDCTGVTRVFARTGWGLWAFPDSHTLVAMPDPKKVKSFRQLLLWHGGSLHVTWRGIQG